MLDLHFGITASDIRKDSCFQSDRSLFVVTEVKGEPRREVELYPESPNTGSKDLDKIAGALFSSRRRTSGGHTTGSLTLDKIIGELHRGPSIPITIDVVDFTADRYLQGKPPEKGPWPRTPTHYHFVEKVETPITFPVPEGPDKLGENHSWKAVPEEQVEISPDRLSANLNINA